MVARGVSKCSIVELDGLILGLGQMHCNTSANVDGLVLELFRQYGIVAPGLVAIFNDVPRVGFSELEWQNKLFTLLPKMG